MRARSTVRYSGIGLALALGLAWGAPGRAALPVPALVGVTREQANEAVARRFYDTALNAKDFAKIGDLTSQWVVHHNAPAGDEVIGGKRLAAAYTQLAQSFPDYQFQLREVLAVGNKVTVRYRFTGTQRGELLGLKVSGKPVAVWGVETLRIEEGKIRELWGTPLTVSLFTQIGAFGAAAPVTGAVD